MRVRLTSYQLKQLLVMPIIDQGEHYHAINSDDPAISQDSYRSPDDALALVSMWAAAAFAVRLPVEQTTNGFLVTAPKLGKVAELYVDACTEKDCPEPIGKEPPWFK